MRIETDEIQEKAKELGIHTCIEFDPGLLVPEERIRELCYENKCGNYRAHYMCPPHVGSVEDAKRRLGEFQRGMLLQYSEALDVMTDIEGLLRAKKGLHTRVLRMEEYLRSGGLANAWGLIGGSCSLCDPCKARSGEPCPQPDEARPSLEAMAIDLLALLDRYGLDSRFHPDKVIWTGCVLF
jgi:predicted metal-binding protein